MYIKAYFENIHEIIIQQLEKAQQEVLIAVAWFTDEEIYQTLCKVIKKGVSVSIVLIKDKINSGRHGLNFKHLQEIGGKIQFIPPQGKQGTLMHHKFCIIDNNKVITGSYNWSKRARSNNENITLIQDNPIIVQQFLEVFNDLQRGREENITLPKPEIVRRRLEMIRNLVLLEESEDIDHHLQKLSPHAFELDINDILENLKQGNYQEALEGIQNYLARMSAIVSTETTEIPRLRFELSILELRLEALSNEKNELERLLIVFNRRHDEVLGDLITKVLKAQAEFIRIEAENAKKAAEQFGADNEELRNEAKKTEDRAKEAENDYREYSQNHESLKNEVRLPALNQEEERELKLLFRKASNICHPDKVPDEQKDDAHSIFIELQKSYKSNDLEKVRALYRQIKDGNFKTTKSTSLSKVELLKSAIAKMKLQINSLADELKAINQSDSIKRFKQAGETEEEWLLFFNKEKINLIRMLNEFNVRIQSLQH